MGKKGGGDGKARREKSPSSLLSLGEDLSSFTRIYREYT